MTATTRSGAGPIRVVVLGTGQMGSAVVRLLRGKPGVELTGVVARRHGRAGLDVGEALGLDSPIGLTVSGDLPAVLAVARPDVVIQTTCSLRREAEPELRACIEAGADVISIAEELAWPAAGDPGWAARLDAAARAHGVTVLGTGVNPGFVLDLLVIALTGVCAEVRSITATRVNDLSPYGPTVLRTQGVGLTPAAFAAGVADGTVVGHVGFVESIGMIAAALGWTVDRIEQERRPIVSTVRRETPFVVVEPGMVAGCHHTATGWHGDQPLVRLVHPQQIRPEAEGELTGDTIDIDGVPPVRLAGSPEIPGGTATAALAVNMIPRVLAAPPGLASMASLPVPAATLGDLRELIDRSPVHA